MEKLIFERSPSPSKPSILPKVDSVPSANSPLDAILKFIPHAYFFPHPLLMWSSQYSGVPSTIHSTEFRYYHYPL